MKKNRRYLSRQKKKNEIRNKYGLLTVIKEDISKNGKTYWQCKCDCGNITSVSVSNLRAGQVKSCGKCVNKNKFEDLSKRIFGNVLIENKAFTRNKKIYWNCKCLLCGNNFITRGTNLKSKHTRSCGCTKASLGEMLIEKILKEHNVEYKKEYIFDDFKTKYKGVPKFDFAIFEKEKLKYLIEYDGEQHFHSTSGWNSEECLLNTTKRDKLKNEYCKRNNIPLIRIPYTLYESLKLEDIMLETSKYIKSSEEIQDE